MRWPYGLVRGLLLAALLLIMLAAPSYAQATPQVTTPPADWNPVTATDAELGRYNYPPRPTTPAQYQQWVELVTKTRWTAPRFERGRTPTRAGIAPAGVQDPDGPAHLPTLNWGGIVSMGSYTAVSGRWRQPFAYADEVSRPALATQWIGLGGHGPGVPLIQMGTEARVNPDGSGSYDAWWEIVGTSADTDGALTLRFPHRQGDQFHSQIWWTEANGEGTAHFYIADLTLGTSTSFSVPGITGYEGVTTSAEWINEVPTLKQGSAFLSLPYYESGEQTRVSFWESRAGTIDNLRYPDPNARSTTYVTTHRGEKLLQSVSTLSETGDFQTLWYEY